MGWDGMGWDGMGWDGMGWDGMGMRWHGMARHGMAWHGCQQARTAWGDGGRVWGGQVSGMTLLTLTRQATPKRVTSSALCKKKQTKNCPNSCFSKLQRSSRCGPHLPAGCQPRSELTQAPSCAQRAAELASFPQQKPRLILWC